MAFEPRVYRGAVAPQGLVTFEVVELETDLLIAARSDLGAEALGLVREARSGIEAAIARDSLFATSFVPVEVAADAHPVVARMAEAARAAGVTEG
mgnify:CR=1 FL=1